MISEMLSRYSGGNNQGKTVANAKVSATSADTVAKKDKVAAPKITPGQCPRCGDAHGLPECPVYKDMSASDRRRFNKNQGLCFRCLKHGHMMKTCESTTIKCDKCDTAHHPLVHPEPNVANAAKDGANGAPAEEKAA